tara:strand:+ start:9959 stop:11389 length:1431 start_codon:yes stop_codon:yes gene_type:complete
MDTTKLYERFHDREDRQGILSEVMKFLTEMSMPAKDAEGKAIDIKLPTLKFTEDWGKPDNDDRVRIERYMKNIAGDSIAAKLDGLRNILDGSVKDAGVGVILSTLIMIEILSTLAGDEREFTESAAGFIFEGFLAGLFGGQSVQIVDVGDDDEQTGKPITDVILGGRHYSLKLLGPTTAVKGSWKNMIGHFEKDEPGEIVYLDARRTKDGNLHFSEFVITLPTFLQIFADPFKKHYKEEKVGPFETVADLSAALEMMKVEEARVNAVATTKKWNNKSIHKNDPKPGGRQGRDELLSLPKEELAALGPFMLRIQPINLQGAVMQKLFGSIDQYEAVQAAIATGSKDATIDALKQTRGYAQKPEQFSFSKGQIASLGDVYVDLGTIPLGEKALKEVWKNYAQMLLTTIDPVYRNLQEFTDNVDQFFLGAGEKGEGNRRSFGEAAIREAKELRQATDKAIKIVTADERQLPLPGMSHEE